MKTMISHKRAAKLLFLFMLPLLVLACNDSSSNHYKLSGPTMGTRYHITVLEKDTVKLDNSELQAVVDEQLSVLNQQFSTYLPDSELSKLNNRVVGTWTNVSNNLFDLLMMSLELSWLSNGAFDITVGPLVNLWGFGPGGADRPDEIPDANAIAQLREQLGFEYIEFDILKHSVLKQRPINLDLSSIAKGFAADKIAELLSYAGYTDFMIEVGGELRLQGNSPKGKPWKIAIESPEAGAYGKVHQVVNVSNVGMATSGDYRNFFDLEGSRYSHTIDPSTGYPVDHNLVSVTVISDTAAYADGLATAISVLGPDKGMALAKNQGLAVYMIVKSAKDFEVRMSEAFKPYLDK